MHDLMAARDISQAVLKEAKKNKLKKVTRIIIDLGEVEDHGELILEDNIRFHLSHLLKGTIAEKAMLKFNKTKSNSVILKEIEGE